MTDLYTDGPRRRVRVTLVAVVVAPIVVAVVRALRHDWFPIGDSALLYIRARDVLTAHHPLLGSWTSASLSVGENMNNPGALYDDLMAPTSRLLGFSSAAAIGVGAINALSVVGIAAASRAIGGWAMQRWMLLTCGVLTWIMGSELLIDIWQAHALLLPFLAYVVLLVGLAVGQSRWLPWAAGVATLLVQTHISYVYVLTVVTVAAIAANVVMHRPVPWSRWRDAVRSRATIATVIVVAVLWAQPVWEQLFGAGRGNMTRLLTNSSGGDVKLGPAIATRFSAQVLVQPAWRLRSGFSDLLPPTGTTQAAEGPFVELTRPILGLGPAVAVLLLLAAVLVGLGTAAHRRGVQARAAACWIAAGGVLGAPLCLALVTVGRFFAPHHVRWMWAFGAFVNVVVLWSVIDEVAARWRRPAAVRALAAVPVALTVLAAAAAVPYLAQQQGPVADYASMPALRHVFRQVETLRSSAPVVYDTSDTRPFEAYSSTIMMRLQELGIEFRVTDEGMVRQLGDARRADGTESTTLFQLEGRAAMEYDGPACRVAIASALTPGEEASASAAADGLAAAIANVIVDADALPPELRELAAAAAGGDEVAARSLVLDGAADDALSDQGAPADEIDVVRRWVDTTFALFALNPRECPTEP